MAAIIDGIIPTQRFELVRDKLGVILTEELANQAILQSDPLFSAPVYVGRFIAFDKVEIPAINIYFTDASYTDGSNPKNTTSETRFNIDVAVKAKHTILEEGDLIASTNLDTLMGVIRYILEYPAYIRMGFPLSPAFIYNTRVEGMQKFQPSDQDGTHTVTGRLIFIAKINEDNGDLEGIPGIVTRTQVKLGTSDEGYAIETN